MLNTIKATLLPSGMLTFDEALPLDHPVPVLVTLLEERPATHPKPLPLSGGNPLDWPITGEARGGPETTPAHLPRKTLRQMNGSEREQYLQEMHARWQGQQSSSDEFARHKQEEISLENRRWESNE